MKDYFFNLTDLFFWGVYSFIFFFLNYFVKEDRLFFRFLKGVPIGVFHLIILFFIERKKIKRSYFLLKNTEKLKNIKKQN